MENHPDLSLRKLTHSDTPEILELMKKYFFGRETFFSTIGCGNDDTINGITSFVEDSVTNGVCMGFREKQTGRLIGVKVCTVVERGHTATPYVLVNDSRKVQDILRKVFGSLPSAETLFEDPKINKIIHGLVTTIHSDYAGRNLAQILHNACDKAGMEKGCQVFYSHIANSTMLKNMVKRGCIVLGTAKFPSIEFPEYKYMEGKEEFSMSAIAKFLIPGNYKLKSLL